MTPPDHQSIPRQLNNRDKKPNHRQEPTAPTSGAAAQPWR